MLGVGGAIAAAWLGLIPGVQLRDLPPERVATERPVESDSVSTAPDTSGEIPTDAAIATGAADTVRITAADSAAGGALYAGVGRCVGCHGSAGEGAATLGPALRDAEWLHGGTRDAIARVVAEGASPALGAYAVAMPAYAGQLSATQLAQVSAYVWSLSHPGAIVPDSRADSLPPIAPSDSVPPPSTAPVPRPTVPPPA